MSDFLIRPVFSIIRRKEDRPDRIRDRTEYGTGRKGKIDTLPVTHPEPYRVEIRELEPLKIRPDTGHKVIAGYMVSSHKRYPLPTGSTVKDGFFLWSPGPGFFGTYRLEFVLEDQAGRLSKREIEIAIQPY